MLSAQRFQDLQETLPSVARERDLGLARQGAQGRAGILASTHRVAGCSWTGGPFQNPEPWTWNPGEARLLGGGRWSWDRLQAACRGHSKPATTVTTQGPDWQGKSSQGEGERANKTSFCSVLQAPAFPHPSPAL